MNDFEFTSEILSIKEATLLADLFDEIGDVHNANVVDEYIIKMASVQDDMIKQAGLFKNMLSKLVGFGKRIFFKVYRDLYNRAKEVQELLEQRIDKINDVYKQVKKDLKYHDLEGWRGGIQQLNLANSKQITADFDIAYGKLVQYLGLTGDINKSDKKTEKELSTIEKLPDLVEKAVEEGEEKPGEKSPWERITPGAKEGWTEVARNISFNPAQGSLRIDKKYFEYLLGKHLVLDNGNVRYFSSYTEKQQPLQGKLKTMMGDQNWKLKEDENFAFLYPEQLGTEKGAPPLKSEEIFKDPKLPRPETSEFFKIPGETPEEIYPLEKRKEIYPLEKRKEKPIAEPDLEKVMEDVKQETPEELIPEEIKPEVGLEPEVETPEVSTEIGEEPNLMEKIIQKPSIRETVWVEKKPPQRKRDGGLWSRFTRVYLPAGEKYEKQGSGIIVKDKDLINLLNNAVQKNFLGHNAGVSKIWLPTNLDDRKVFVNELKNLITTKKSRLELIEKLYSMS